MFARAKAPAELGRGRQHALQASAPHLLHRATRLLAGARCLEGIVVGVSGAHPSTTRHSPPAPPMPACRGEAAMDRRTRTGGCALRRGSPLGGSNHKPALASPDRPRPATTDPAASSIPPRSVFMPDNRTGADARRPAPCSVTGGSRGLGAAIGPRARRRGSAHRHRRYGGARATQCAQSLGRGHRRDGAAARRGRRAQAGERGGGGARALRPPRRSRQQRGGGHHGADRRASCADWHRWCGSTSRAVPDAKPAVAAMAATAATS